MRLERRPPGHDVGVPQNAQHRGHHEVCRRETILQVGSISKPVLNGVKPLLHHFHCGRAARSRPTLAGVEQVDFGEVLDVGLNRVQGGKNPRTCARPSIGIGRHQRLGPFGDMDHDGARLEQLQISTLDRRDLAERL